MRAIDPVVLCVRVVDHEWFIHARVVDPGVECGKGRRPCWFSCVRAVDPELFMRARVVDPGVECGKGCRPWIFMCARSGRCSWRLATIIIVLLPHSRY